jgi:hypothetical protein
MKRTTLVIAAALLVAAAVHPAFAKLAGNKLAGNTLSLGAQSGTVAEVSSIVLLNGEVLGR